MPTPRVKVKPEQSPLIDNRDDRACVQGRAEQCGDVRRKELDAGLDQLSRRGESDGAGSRRRWAAVLTRKPGLPAIPPAWPDDDQQRRYGAGQQ